MLHLLWWALVCVLCTQMGVSKIVTVCASVTVDLQDVAQLLAIENTLVVPDGAELLNREHWCLRVS